MKNSLIFGLAIILSVLTTSCSDDDNQSANEILRYYDSLNTTIPLSPVFSIDTNEVVLSESQNIVRRLTIDLPEISMGQHSSDKNELVSITLTVRGDSIISYKISTSLEAQKSSNVRLIKKGDTLISLAKEFGVHPSKIKNKNPLRIGDVVKIEN